MYFENRRAFREIEDQAKQIALIYGIAQQNRHGHIRWDPPFMGTPDDRLRYEGLKRKCFEEACVQFGYPRLYYKKFFYQND